MKNFNILISAGDEHHTSRGSGKDTFALALQTMLRLHGHDFALDSFALPIRSVCLQASGLTPEFVHERKNEPHKIEITQSELIGAIKDVYNLPDADFDNLRAKGPNSWRFASPRIMLQHVGTDIMRDLIDPAIHTKVAGSKTHKIFTDLRFPNELDLFKNSFHLHVIRSSNPLPDGSISESHGSFLLDKADVVVYNDGNLGDLNQEVYKVTKQIIKEGIL